MYLKCPDLSENKIVSYFTNINNNPYKFLFKWNEYCDCCFLSIYNNIGESILTGIALTVNRDIITDNRLLPSLKFVNQYGLNLEPTPETLKDYVFVYTAE